MLTVLAFGAGVQSTTLLYLSMDGHIPRFDHVIFADTGEEPAEVYAHLDRVRRRCADTEQPFHVVSHSHLGDDLLNGPSPKYNIPASAPKTTRWTRSAENSGTY